MKVCKGVRALEGQAQQNKCLKEEKGRLSQLHFYSKSLWWRKHNFLMIFISTEVIFFHTRITKTRDNLLFSKNSVPYRKCSRFIL